MEDDQEASYLRAVPSSYNRRSYSHGVARGQTREADTISLEQHGAELPRKLDGLCDQLKQFCEVADAPKGRVFANAMADSPCCYYHNGRGGCCPDSSSTLNRCSFQRSPRLFGHNVGLPQFHPAAGCIHGHRHASWLRSFDSRHHHGMCQPRSFNNHIHGQFHSDKVYFYNNDGFHHQSCCACLHCNNVYWLPPAIACPPRSPGIHGFYTAVDGPSLSASHVYDNIPKSRLLSKGPIKLQKTNFAVKQRRPCRPFAGAAPFIVCYGCSDLLQIPSLALQMGKHKHKLRCGTCSQLISFELDGRKLICLDDVSKRNVASSDETTEAFQCHDAENQEQVISHSFDYESSSDHGVCSVGEKIVSPHVLTIEAVEKGSGLKSSDSDSVVSQRDDPSSAVLPAEADASECFASLPSREDFVYSSGKEIVEDVGSRSKCLDQEMMNVSIEENFPENSVNDVLTTKKDTPGEYNPSPDTSLDSSVVWKGEDERRVSNGNKGRDSFVTGLIKKSFRDLTRFGLSSESRKPKVFVNGHYIPDHLVKKAENFAGPIHPGNYWYDYHAGFWGIMGHSCLGIIPPFIEEFNFPMSKNCADGKTGVLVNGRELGEQDLTVLSSRGLPAIEGRSYIIEFSGKVSDEETGKELGSLGKLAPTVERMKRGFGMRSPGIVA